MKENPIGLRFLRSLETYRGWGKFNYLLDWVYTLYYRKRHEPPISLLKRKIQNRPGEIIIVCKGNVCRSAFLAQYLRQILPPSDRFSVTSAGLHTRNGSVSPELAVRCAKKFGVDLSSHTGAQLSRSHVQRADLVVGMEPIHHVEFCLRYFKWRKKFLLLRAIEKMPDSLVIHDPNEKGRKSFQKCFSLLVRDGKILGSVLQEIGGAS